MRLVNEGENVRLLYEAPRSGLGDLGINPGTPLFNGRKTGANSYAGEATTFSKQCGGANFPVAGEATGNGGHVVLRGQAPIRDGRCQVKGYRSETLVFDQRSGAGN